MATFPEVLEEMVRHDIKLERERVNDLPCSRDVQVVGTFKS